mmetsp:Transcript_7274/g.21529  ORF Transcript_7274/g.21529 Transcript_7274/m.21529 type:complete len:194 (-) Transcript_7274:125-706(-)
MNSLVSPHVSNVFGSVLTDDAMILKTPSCGWRRATSPPRLRPRPSPYADDARPGFAPSNAPKSLGINTQNTLPLLPLIGNQRRGPMTKQPQLKPRYNSFSPCSSYLGKVPAPLQRKRSPPLEPLAHGANMSADFSFSLDLSDQFAKKCKNRDGNKRRVRHLLMASGSKADTPSMKLPFGGPLRRRNSFNAGCA